MEGSLSIIRLMRLNEGLFGPEATVGYGRLPEATAPCSDLTPVTFIFYK